MHENEQKTSHRDAEGASSYPAGPVTTWIKIKEEPFHSVKLAKAGELEKPEICQYLKAYSRAITLDQSQLFMPSQRNSNQKHDLHIQDKITKIT